MQVIVSEFIERYINSNTTNVQIFNGDGSSGFFSSGSSSDPLVILWNISGKFDGNKQYVVGDNAYGKKTCTFSSLHNYSGISQKEVSFSSYNGLSSGDNTNAKVSDFKDTTVVDKAGYNVNNQRRYSRGLTYLTNSNNMALIKYVTGKLFYSEGKCTPYAYVRQDESLIGVENTNISNPLECMPKGAILDYNNNRIITSFERYENIAPTQTYTKVNGANILNYAYPCTVINNTIYHNINYQESSPETVYFNRESDFKFNWGTTADHKFVWVEDLANDDTCIKPLDKLMSLNNRTKVSPPSQNLTNIHSKMPVSEMGGVYQGYLCNLGNTLAIIGVKNYDLTTSTSIAIFIKMAFASTSYNSMITKFLFTDTGYTFTAPDKVTISGDDHQIYEIDTNYHGGMMDEDLMGSCIMAMLTPNGQLLLDYVKSPNVNILNYNRDCINDAFLYGISDIDTTNIETLQSRDSNVYYASRSTVTLPEPNLKLAESYYDEETHDVRLIVIRHNKRDIILLDENFNKIGYYPVVGYDLNVNSIMLLSQKGKILIRGNGRPVIYEPII